jgi:hypothetical protein
LEKLDDSIKLGQLFIDYKLLTPFEKIPGLDSDAKKRYPKFLMPAKPVNSKFSEKGFYMWNIPKPRGKLAFFLFLGVIIVIAFMLFSIWPLWLKIGLWYFSFYTLIILVFQITIYIYYHIEWLPVIKSVCMVVLVPFRN